ncbi:MAG: hypothetical protein O3C40_18300 [Planctomycetota bacterium]|nr:hypothetical protein [Planctomycetota bacterium]
MPLAKLPDGLTFPAEITDRIWFDADTQRLVFRGFMSKATFDRLDRLHNDHSYQQAIDDLFRISVYEDAGPPKREFPNRLTGAVLTGMLVGIGSIILFLTR